jgi:hypothetical protein
MLVHDCWAYNKRQEGHGIVCHAAKNMVSRRVKLVVVTLEAGVKLFPIVGAKQNRSWHCTGGKGIVVMPSLQERTSHRNTHRGFQGMQPRRDKTRSAEDRGSITAGIIRTLPLPGM